jgi:hypothetical protein
MVAGGTGGGGTRGDGGSTAGDRPAHALSAGRRGDQASVEKTGRAVVVHEAPRTGGMGAGIAAAIMERCFLSLEAPVVRVTAPDLPYPVGLYEDRYIPNVERALDGIRRAAAF